MATDSPTRFILTAIRSGSADDFLNEVARAVDDRREALARQLIRSLTPGMRIITTPPLRAGYVGLKGTIRTVNQTRVVVMFDHGEIRTVPSTCIALLDEPPQAQRPIVESIEFGADDVATFPFRRRRRH